MAFEALLALGGVALVVMLIIAKCYTFFTNHDDDNVN